MIGSNDKLFVLTGAGVSVESGLPAFRSQGGLWSGPVIEEVCTPLAWVTNPWRVWEFYSARRAAALSVKPNDAHQALAKLESRLGDRFFLCTQNVDDLHEQAGSKRMVHIHGEIHKSRCSEYCGLEPVSDSQVYQSLSEVPTCVCGALMRPHVVFFGETPLELEVVNRELETTTVFMTVGSSGVVQPASNLVRIAHKRGIRTIYVGLEKPKNASKFSEIILGKAGEILPSLICP